MSPNADLFSLANAGTLRDWQQVIFLWPVTHVTHCHLSVGLFSWDVESLIPSWPLLYFRSATDLMLLLILFFFLLLLGRPSSKKPKAPFFQIGSGWNLAGVFLTLICIDWRNWIFALTSWFFKMMIITPFHVEKCWHLVNAQTVFASAYMQQRPPVPDL